MEFENLYEFFTTVCKEKRIKIEQLPQLCGISRSSLYRYMKGLSPIHSKMEKTFCRVMGLGKDECAVFHELIELSLYDNTLLKARTALDKVIFGIGETDVSPIECVLYSDDKYFRSLEEIFQSILAMSGTDGFSCDIKIVNCVHPSVLHHVVRFVDELHKNSRLSTVEHLLSMVKEDYEQITDTFISILTALASSDYPHYTALCNTIVSLHGQRGLFENTVLVEIQHDRTEQDGAGGKETRCYWFSLLEDRISNCIVFSAEDYLYSFLQNSYQEIRSGYPDLLFRSVGMDTFSQEMLHFHSNQCNYLIKPNNCYDKIPYEQYLSLYERCSEEILQSLGMLDGSTADGLTREEYGKQYLDYLRARIDQSFAAPCVDYYSVHGLEDFAKTGRITDHLTNLPPFTKEERRATLEYIRDRNLDEKDSYRLYLTEHPILENGLIFLVARGNGILVEMALGDYREGVYKSILVDNPDLEKIFVDYIEHHITRNYALSQEAATRAINRIIEQHCV